MFRLSNYQVDFFLRPLGRHFLKSTQKTKWRNKDLCERLEASREVLKSYNATAQLHFYGLRSTLGGTRQNGAIL